MSIQVTFIKELCKVMANMYGQMVDSIQVNGKIVKCTAKGFLHGLMVKSMMVAT